MEHLLQLFNSFNGYAKTNPILAGAVGLWGLSVLTFVCRNVPRSLWQWVLRQSTTSLTFTNESRGSSVENFSGFMKWFEANQWAGFSRTLALDGSYNSEGSTISAGGGRHYFRYKGKIFWLDRSRLEQSGNYNIHYQITMTTFGRNRQVFMDLINEFRYRPDESKIGIYTFKENDWKRVADIGKRGLHTVIVKAELKIELLKTIDRFVASRPWYEERGLPYKKTFIFHGVPGTGKTSLVKGLASHYGLNLCVLNLSQMSDTSLEEALNSAPKNCIIVLEDFDSSPATHARAGVHSKKPSKTAKKALSGSSTSTATQPAPEVEEGGRGITVDIMASFLTLSGILNALDGLVSLDGKMIFMTTNRVTTLDAALIRKGRVDHIFEILPLTTLEIWQYVQLMFPGHVVDPSVSFDDILGCDLQGLYFDHQDNADTFVSSIPRIGGPITEWQELLQPEPVHLGEWSGFKETSNIHHPRDTPTHTTT